jgi:hypothetical protein
MKQENPFDKKSITELEEAVRASLSIQKNSIIEATKVLVYLRTTKRYKENKRYAKERFETYLEDLFSVRMGTFRDWMRALPFEAEARTFGVGLVSKTLRLCGPVGTKKAFTEVARLEEVRKEKIIPREKIDQIIVKNQDPRRMAAYQKKEATDWKAMYYKEATAHEATKKRLAEAREQIAELRAQVEKLKHTAEAFGEVRSIFERKYESGMQASA